MVLVRPVPLKHPDSGIFYLRRAVPEALKPIVGKSMEKVSLGTRDPAEARIRHAERLADLELRWAALRQGNAKLSHKQIIAIAGEFYRSLIDEHADEPGDPSTWQYRLFYDRAYFNPEQVKITKLGNWSIDPRTVIAQRYDRPIRYPRSRWPGLTFASLTLDDGRVEIDSNIVERSIRRIALTRKNALFAGSDGGGEHWATIASLGETPKFNDVDPQAYLADVIVRIVAGHPKSRIEKLLPCAFGITDAEAVA